MANSDNKNKQVVVRYSSNVRIGNWNEELFGQEEKIRMFIKKRERGELLIQRSRLMMGNLLKSVRLEKPLPYLYFGNIVQVLNEKVNSSDGINAGLSLSGVITEREVDSSSHFVEGCILSGSRLLVPCVRNAFRIVPVSSDNKEGDVLKYGDYFGLTIIESATSMLLYLESELPQVGGIVGESGHPIIKLTTYPNRYCRWQALHRDPESRPETMNTSIAPGTPIVINHVSSNRNLCAETGYWYSTYFGKECEITVWTYLDIHKKEMSQNIWTFSTSKSEN